MRNLWRVFFSLALLLSLVVVMTPLAYGIDDPDVLELYDIHAYRHYLEDGDLLVTARYRCYYAAHTGLEEVQESYTTGNDAEHAAYGNTWFAQTFTTSVTFSATRIRIPGYIVGTPGYVHVQIRPYENGTVSSATLTVASLYYTFLSESEAWTDFVLSSSYVLETDTTYAIVVSAPTGNVTADVFNWRSDDSSPTYSGGKYLSSSDGGITWTDDTTKDFLFEVYGTLSIGSEIADTFLGRFLDDGVELKAAAPYPYNNDGYGYGIFSLYWTAVDAPAWLGTYTVALEGNPLQSWSESPPSVNSSAIAWHSTPAQSATSGILALNILAAARSLEYLWDIDLIEDTAAGPRLATRGVEYFTNAVPNLRVGCPNVFSTSTTTVGWEEVVHDTTYQEELGETWDNTPMKEGAGGLGEFFGGLSGNVVMTFMFILFAAGIVAASVMGIGPQVTAPLLIVLVLMGPVTGFVPLQIALVVGGLAGATLAFTLFYRVIT